MYRNFLFDCDGVLLNSNSIKSQGFLFAAAEYGQENAQELLNFHKLNGGISRYKKFQIFITNILKKPFSESIYQDLLKKYSTYISNELLKCELAPNIKRNREIFCNSKWYVVSGGDEKELRKLFKERRIDFLFDGGIYGSPRNKFEIFKTILPDSANKDNSIFLGDSSYDFEAASSFGISFRYISKWSEFTEIKLHAKKNKIKLHDDLQSFFEDIQGEEPPSQSFWR